MVTQITSFGKYPLKVTTTLRNALSNFHFLRREISMPVYLVPQQKGRPIVVDKAVIFIGRHPECDVVLKNSRKISRRHCCLCQINDKLMVRDLGSMNGVRVNGQRVKKEMVLALNDEIKIGDIQYAVKIQKPESASIKQRRSDKQNGAAPDAIEPQAMDYSQEFPVPIKEEDFSSNSSGDPEPYKLQSDDSRDYNDSDSVNDLLPD